MKDVFIGSEKIGTIETGSYGRGRGKFKATTIDGKCSFERTAGDARDFLVANAGARAAVDLAKEAAATARLADVKMASLIAEMVQRAKEGEGDNRDWESALVAVLDKCDPVVQSSVAIRFLDCLDHAQAEKALSDINGCCPEAVQEFMADFEDVQSIQEKARDVADVLRYGALADRLAVQRELECVALA